MLVDKLRKSWMSPIYAFFDHKVDITYVEGRPCIEFICSAKNCKGVNGPQVRRFLDKKDRGSTSNMWQHAMKCFGEGVIKQSKQSTIKEVRKGLARYKENGSIALAFEAQGQGVVTYSNQPLSKIEMRYVLGHFWHEMTSDQWFGRIEMVQWVAKDKHAFQIVEDCAFRKVMRTGPGRHNQYIPSALTVGRDVRTVFVAICQWIARMFQVSFIVQQEIHRYSPVGQDSCPKTDCKSPAYVMYSALGK